MNKFKDFNIPAPKVNTFVGDKIPVKKLLNQPIRVHDYRIEPSKKKEGANCLYLQIEKSGDKRVVFTGSNGLMDQIKQVPREHFPFETTIRQDNDYYEFT